MRAFQVLIVAATEKWSADNVPRLAAALSFYAVLSLAPLLVFAVVVGGYFLGQGTTLDHLVGAAQGYVGKDGAEFLKTLVSGANKPTASALATVVSLGITFFSASNLFIQLNDSVNVIWDIRQTGHIVKVFFLTRLAAFLGVIGFGAIVLTWLGLDTWLTWIAHQTQGYDGLKAISLLFTILFFTAVFAVTFRLMPRGRVTWTQVWIPAVVTAVGIALSKYALGLYFAYAGVASAYGTAGALVVILLWIYYTAQIVFFGFELARVSVPATLAPTVPAPQEHS